MLATLLAGAFLATAATAAPAHVPTTTAAAAKKAVTATLVRISPQVTRPGEDVAVTVEVHNGTTKTVAEPRVSLSLSRVRPSTRADVDAWVKAAPTEDVGAVLAGQDAPDALAPGATWRATVTAKADTIGLTAVWGPRPLAVTVTDGEGSSPTTAPRLAVLRSFLLWYPVGAEGAAASSETVTPVNLSIAVPLTGPAVEPTDPDAQTTGDDAGSDSTSSDGTAAATSSAAAAALDAATSGRLAHVVDATAAADGVTWVADPALVASASRSSGSAAWAREVCAAAKARDTYLLPAFDADVAALAHAGHDVPRGSASATTARCGTSETGTDLRHAWNDGLAWPATGTPDKATYAASVRSGRSLVVARGSEDGPLSPVTPTATTPDAVTTVDTPAGDATALVADDQLSDLLARTHDTAEAIQLVLAQTAVIARQADSDPTEAAQLLATLPRSWDPDPTTAGTELAALDDAPWIALQPLSTLAKAQPDDVVRRAPAASSASDKELDPESVDALLSARSSVGRFATVVEDPQAVTAPIESDTLAPLAVAYRADAEARAHAVRSGLDAARAVTASVSVVGGSTLNIISAQGDLPVTVRNSLDQPARVRVELHSTDPKLKVLKTPEVTVAAHDSQTVGVPVRAIGNGNVSAYVELLTPSGSTITTAPAFDVRVRASWETVATTVIVVLLGLGLVAGIWRTVRRGRSSARVTRAQAPEAEVAGTPEATGQVPVAPPAPGNVPPGPPPHGLGTPPPAPHDPARHDTEDQPSDPATPAGRSGPA
ncbi:hypothetical protein GCM10025864_14620 [Luteimicrobium album]|uniref:Secreted protein n=1 Tax=Luteimicrobium album TaxID=1054550 RepID=A0ABQ6I0M3_9MICO|nr:hypothetical protein GCM10025864_14620 [Luteimicrobium album]